MLIPCPRLQGYRPLPDVLINMPAMPAVQCCQIVAKRIYYFTDPLNDSSRKSLSCGYFCLARATGLEPATTGSTVGAFTVDQRRTFVLQSDVCPDCSSSKHDVDSLPLLIRAQMPVAANHFLSLVPHPFVD